MKKICALILMMILVSSCTQGGEISTPPNSEAKSSSIDMGTSIIEDRDNGIKQFVTSFSSNYILTQTGDVYSWGRDSFGELGLGLDTKSYISTPQKVDTLSNIEKLVTAPSGFTVAALAKDNSLYLWGQNLYNLTGDNSGVSISLPTKVAINRQIKDISLASTTLSILTTSGEVYSYGWNYENGPIIAELADRSMYAFESLHKEDIPTDNPIKEIALGTFLSAYLDDKGNVYCKGYVYNSQLTFGEEEIIKVEFPEEIKHIYANEQNIVALSKTGNLYGMGVDGLGIIGYEDYKEYPNPVLIDKIEDKIKRVSMSTSSIIVETDKYEYYQWGYNVSNGISNENTELVQLPKKLDISNVKNFFSGTFNSTYISTDNKLYAWGNNYNNVFIDESIPSQENKIEVNFIKN